MRPRAFAVVLAGAALLSGPGCFKSSTLQASSESSSGSSAGILGVVSSPFTWSSGSSGGGSGSEDVEQTAALYVRSGGDLDAFRRDLGRIAREHGISDWESFEPIYWSIGRGLRRAGVEAERLETWKTTLADSRPRYMTWIQRGYDGAEGE